MPDLSVLQKTLTHQFKDGALLKEALTHRSYLNERPDWGSRHNERLEFLGDAVIELIVTEELYNRFPDHQEGMLTSFRAALVNYQMLARVAREINLHDFIFLSRGEAKDAGKAREVIMANAFEAIVGALYLDGGHTAAKNFVLKSVLPHLNEVISEELYRDAKSLLQEKVQSERKHTPTYAVLRESGPDHQKTFHVGVYSGEALLGEGAGLSKQEAEVEAAKQALEQFTK